MVSSKKQHYTKVDLFLEDHDCYCLIHTDEGDEYYCEDPDLIIDLIVPILESIREKCNKR